MARNFNSSSLENFNGSARSARSVHSSRAHHSVGPVRSTTSRAPDSARRRTNRNHNRNHTYPAPVAEEYHYADNSAAGHSLYHSSRIFNQPTTTIEEPTTIDQYSNQAASRSQTYLLPVATYTTETYDSVLELEDDQAEYTEMASIQSEEHPSHPEEDQSPNDQNSLEGEYQYRQEETYPDSRSNSDYGHDDYGMYPSRPDTDGEDDDEYYIEQPSTPPQRETYNIRPHSPTTQRYLQEPSTQDRIRMGLPRYETVEEERHAYEPVTLYESTRNGNSFPGSSRSGSTRR